MTEEKYHLDESAIKWTKAEEMIMFNKSDVESIEEAIKRLEQERDGLKSLVDFEIQKREVVEQERDELKKTVENQKLEYEELQCDLSEVENACGCYQSENAKLKQENKALKDNNNYLQAIIDDGRAENKRFREENKELKKQIESDKGLITVGGKQQYDMTMAYDKCKTTLEEIMEIIRADCKGCTAECDCDEDCTRYKIKNKIRGIK